MALLKNTTSSTLYNSAYPSSSIVDGVINFDQAAGNIFHSLCDGTGWVQVDLGGVYNVVNVIVWNRYATGDATGLAAKLSGATVEYRNWYGDLIGTSTLNSYAVQTLNVTLYPPTPTRSATATSSITPSSSVTATTTGTATISTGASSSASPSATASASLTPTPSATFVAMPRWMSALKSRPQTIAVTASGGFIGYRIAPFDSALRTEVNGTVVPLGTYAGWSPLVQDATCPSGLRYYEQRYWNGSAAACSPGVQRSAVVRYSCHPQGLMSLAFLSESPTCNFIFTLQIDCSGNYGTLCLEVTPSPTPSNSPTSSNTGSVSSTATSSASTTASITASPTSSITAGATNTQTSSNSGTASNTPPSSVTPSRTPSATSTPLSPWPYMARVVATNVQIGVTELMVFSNTGRLLSASAAGAANDLSSKFSVAQPYYGGDLCCNPYASSCLLAETTAAGAQSYTSVFPGGFNGAVPVSTVYFVNNVAFPTRITSGGGRLELVSPNGSVAASGALSSAHITQLNFEPSLAPVYPNPADAFQTDVTARRQHVRYVRITATAASLLTFREVMVRCPPSLPPFICPLAPHVLNHRSFAASHVVSLPSLSFSPCRSSTTALRMLRS